MSKKLLACRMYTHIWEQTMLRRCDRGEMDKLGYTIEKRLATLLEARRQGKLTPPCDCPRCLKK